MNNPFAEKISDDDELSLIKESLRGDRSSLEKLVLRHQAALLQFSGYDPLAEEYAGLRRI
jgi:RNA polymerase, sigma subunit, ECF family